MKISVALCTYNGEKFIRQQLDSIVHQVLPVSEIIVSDDCSTDNTMAIVKEFADRFTSISWIISCNSDLRLGVLRNFERALLLCTGDIIFLSDQDDIWLPNKTEQIVSTFNNNNKTQLIFSDALLIDECGNILSSYSLFDVVGLSTLKNHWNAGLEFEIENMGQRLLGCTFGIKKELINKTIPFINRTDLLHDAQLAMNAVIHNTVYMLPERLMYYRIHSNNTVGLNISGIFNNDSYHSDAEDFLYEPRKADAYFKNTDNIIFNKRVSFYEKREHYYKSIWGKLILLLSYLSYFKFYGKYAFPFFKRDLFYGFK